VPNDRLLSSPAGPRIESAPYLRSGQLYAKKYRHSAVPVPVVSGWPGSRRSLVVYVQQHTEKGAITAPRRRCVATHYVERLKQGRRHASPYARQLCAYPRHRSARGT